MITTFCILYLESDLRSPVDIRTHIDLKATATLFAHDVDTVRSPYYWPTLFRTSLQQWDRVDPRSQFHGLSLSEVDDSLAQIEDSKGGEGGDSEMISRFFEFLTFLAFPSFPCIKGWESRRR